MGMAEEDDLTIGVGSIQLVRCRDAERVTMGEQEPESIDFDVHHVGQPITQGEAVCIAVDGGNRSDRFQLGQNVERTDVSGMEDPIDLLENGKDLGAQKTMRIRDDPETHSPTSAPAPPALGDLDIECEMIEDALDNEIH